MRDILVTFVLLGAVPYALFAPYVGVLFWCLISYMNPHRLTYGFAQHIPFAQIIGGATLLGLLLSREEKRFPWNAVTFVWILFVAWMSFTTIYALFPDEAFEKWVLVMKIMLMSLVSLMVMAQRERLNLLVWVIVLSVGFYGTKGGLFTLFNATGGTTLVYGPQKSFIEDNNALGLALVMTLPLMYYVSKQAEGKIVKFGMRAVMLLSAVAVIGTHSRGAALGLATVAVGAVLSSRYKVRALLALAVVGVIGTGLVPQTWTERVGTIKHYEEDQSAMARITAWRTAYNLASDRFLGGGFDTMQQQTYLRYSPGSTLPRNTHSIYFEVLAEHGFTGLFLFLILGATVLWTIVRIRSQSRGRDDLAWSYDLGTSVGLGFVGFLISGAFLNLAYFDLCYHLIAITVLVQVIVKEHIAMYPDVESFARSNLQPVGNTDYQTSTSL